MCFELILLNTCESTAYVLRGLSLPNNALFIVFHIKKHFSVSAHKQIDKQGLQLLTKSDSDWTSEDKQA